MGKIKSILEKLNKFVAQDKSITRIFTVLFLGAGLLFVFLVPPFQNPDEQMHFYRSYQLSHLNLFADSNQDGVYGGTIPNNITDLVEESDFVHRFNFDHRFRLDLNELVGYTYQEGPKSFQAFPNTAIYSPLVYLHTLPVQKVAEYVHAPILLTLYIGRIFSLLIVFLAFIFAIKYAPIGRWVFFAIGLIPMTIASAAAFSSDAVTIAISIAFIVVILKLCFIKQIHIKWLVAGSSLALSLAFIKQAHIGLALLLLLPFIINPLLRLRKIYFWVIATAVTTGLSLAWWYTKVSSIKINPDPLVQPELQKELVLNNPLQFLVEPFFQTYATLHSNAFTEGLFGNFGWLTTPMPLYVIILSAITLFLAIKQIDKKEQKSIDYLSNKKGIFATYLIMVFVAIVGLISVALYIYWTAYKLPYIQGIQGRYFLPILPLLLIPLALYTKKNSSRATLILLIITVLIIAIATLFGRFYVSTPVL